MPTFGVGAGFGMIAFGGLLASSGVFEGYSSIINLVSDLTGDKITYYYATLPLPTWLMLTRFIISHACLYMVLTLTFLPMGKLLLWNSFDLGSFDVLRFLIILVFANLFYGAFALFSTSFIDNMNSIGTVWARFIFPLWFLGGFMFSWQSLYKTSPIFAYIDLCNPIIYIAEGYRSALTGQPEGYIHFWICIGMISFFALIAGWIGIRRLKKRCDFI
jgi:ABC-type polysaccharide/polyol phosphate export permease